MLLVDPVSQAGRLGQFWTPVVTVEDFFEQT
ncbi:hypothetical protein GGE09_002713 [Roseobacter sp. N2S]|nr:hypothetical protein [Roseobacter sp. N2S]